MKPGYKTTEFWLSIAAFVLGAVMSSGAITEGSAAERAVGGVIAILATMGYTASRTTTKKQVPPTDGPELP